MQWRIIRALAGLQPPWTLTGGAALGIHLGHRGTRDVDLFFRGLRKLADLPRQADFALVDSGLAVTRLQSDVAFQRFRVSDGSETCLVDLVADPVAPVTPPERHGGDFEFLLDSPHELLVNKLCALLSRSELRDLVDIRALLAAGGDFDRALADAPRKDGGFSPLTVAWLLRDWQPAALARSAGFTPAEASELERFHGELIERLTRAGAPD